MKKPREKVPLPERFWSKVLKAGPDDCWEWQGYCTPKGYGSVKDENNKTDRCHRVALRLSGVPVGFGDVVMHSCDNPPCCNPTHLSVGTIEDNTQDMVNKGRHRGAKGERNYNSKLTREQVDEIRSKYSDRKISTEKIAKLYGVSQPMVSYILIGKNW